MWKKEARWFGSVLSHQKCFWIFQKNKQYTICTPHLSLNTDIVGHQIIVATTKMHEFLGFSYSQKSLFYIYKLHSRLDCGREINGAQQINGDQKKHKFIRFSTLLFWLTAKSALIHELCISCVFPVNSIVRFPRKILVHLLHSNCPKGGMQCIYLFTNWNYHLNYTYISLNCGLFFISTFHFSMYIYNYIPMLFITICLFIDEKRVVKIDLFINSKQNRNNYESVTENKIKKKCVQLLCRMCICSVKN